MTTDRDDAPVRRYRAASAALDERPSTEARATILAAAARQVEARPGSTAAPRVARRPRWPLAAAAAVLLSSLAVMMANRTEQEMPSFTAPAERVSAPVAVAPAPPVAAPPASGSAAPVPAPPVAQAPAPIAPPSTTASAREERAAPAASAERADAQRPEVARSATSAGPAERAPESANAEARQDLPAPPPAAPSRAAPLARSLPAPAAAGAMAAPDSGSGKPASSSTERASARAAAPASQDVARLEAARDFEGSAPLWLERIVQLRRAGSDAEADAELKRFRERYPDVPVPPAALPAGAAGTR